MCESEVQLDMGLFQLQAKIAYEMMGPLFDPLVTGEPLFPDGEGGLSYILLGPKCFSTPG